MDALNANGKAKQVRKPSYTLRKTPSQREKKRRKKRGKQKQKTNKNKRQKKKNLKKKKGGIDELLMFIVGKDSALFSGL